MRKNDTEATNGALVAGYKRLVCSRRVISTHQFVEVSYHHDDTSTYLLM